jgi:hypothetical protein
MSLHPRAEQSEEDPPYPQMSPEENSPVIPGNLARLEAARRSFQEGASPTPALDNLERIHSECGEGLVSHPIAFSESGSDMEGKPPLRSQNMGPQNTSTQELGLTQQGSNASGENLTSAHGWGAAISQEGALACNEGQAGASCGSDRGEMARPNVNFQR